MREAGAHSTKPGATIKGARKRSDLIDLAEEILFDAGHEALTLRAVAARASIRLGHLQYYFPSRADLVAALLSRIVESALARLAPRLGRQGVEHPAEEIVHVLLADHKDIRLVRVFAELWALAGRDEAVAAALTRFYGSYRDMVSEAIGARNPTLAPELCRQRASVFIALIEGASLFRSGIADSLESDTDATLVSTAVALLEDGRR
ncbi:TetR/AcrR family transcriptional regulator [Mycobacteroides abscessus subsp. abscessus]|uniref:TetR/AcrR family transcriptional regulator n=1 Tax=Mycobacteroides abscessus TaxID=36809 RepID=UPI0009A75CFA|nr:TetR family transcriptional regulator [Mycobacteroides abscessus]MBN7439427.1 TetR/AcrR family transcriptional regulator [Mycobacteroides abscessus subsp. abscessus]SLH35386.1 TetR family transcriptional regulator [Mycobacteroides abscessus subsp. abscessus]